MRNIEYIVIHCTGTAPSVKVDAVKNYWKNHLGWKNPGYHILIDANGIPNYLAPFENVTNGVKGFNHNSIHIAYIGGKGGADTRTLGQKATLLTCLREVIEFLGYVPIIQGHKDFPGVSKSCPNFDAKNEYSWI